MKWRERRRREQNGRREQNQFHRELPAMLTEQRQRLLEKGGPAHPEIPFDPRPKL